MDLITRTFPSGSMPGLTYTTQMDRHTGIATCTCPGAQRSIGLCWHAKHVADRVCRTPCPHCGGDIELVEGQSVGGQKLAVGVCLSCSFTIRVSPDAERS